MDSAAYIKKSKQANPLTLQVLKLPAKNSLIQMPSLECQYKLVHHSRKKINLAVYLAEVPKSKLLTNLEIYEWRHQTDFPIVKTCYVAVKGRASSSANIVEIQVLIEHCPLRLKHIYEITVGQTLFLLKECVVGFERLFNRFGGFDITENMIAVNEKGFCKVWVNENFSLNSMQKNNCKEVKMVQKIIGIIESHSCDSKASKKLFGLLQNSNTFLQVLKLIQIFSASSKILVPCKFLFLASVKQQSDSFKGLRGKNKFQNTRNTRFSIKSPEKKLARDKSKDDILRNIHSSRKLSTSPFLIKRIKSEDKIPLNMKVSDGQTAYTQNPLDTKKSTNFSSPPTSPQYTNAFEANIRNNRKKWIEQSSFFLGGEDPQKSRRAKRELTHSEAFQIEQSPTKNTERKFSINFIHSKNKPLSPLKLFSEGFEKEKAESYISQFSSLLQDERESKFSSPLKKIFEDDEDKMRQKHQVSIIKTNGWENCFLGLLQTPKELEQSFHAGEEENHTNKDLKLEKLAKFGRREVAMSILPEECEELF